MNSREEANGLPATARAQLKSAGRTLLGARDLASLLDWSDREGIGWYQLMVDDGRGAPMWDVWLLTTGNDGVVFAHDTPFHLGLIVSQGSVVDVERERTALVQQLQQALDTFEPPAFRGWLNHDPKATARLQAVAVPWPLEEP